MYKHSGWHYTKHWRNGKSITSDVNWLIDWLPSNLFCFRPERCGIHILHAPSRLASPVLLQGRLGLNNILILIFLLLTSYWNSWRHLDTLILGRPILLSFTPEMQKTIHVPRIRGGSQGCPVSSKCELRPCRLSTFLREDLSHHGLLDVRARGVTVFYIPWRQIWGDFLWFPFWFSYEKPAWLFLPERFGRSMFLYKKSSLKGELIHTKGSNNKSWDIHLPWEFSCHLTSTSGRWKLHCIHHSCSSGRFLDARIGGWLGSQKSFRKNVDEKPANFMILVDEHPSFSKNILLERTWEHINFFLLRCAIYVKLQPCGSIDVHWPLPEDGELILKRYL